MAWVGLAAFQSFLVPLIVYYIHVTGLADTTKHLLTGAAISFGLAIILFGIWIQRRDLQIIRERSRRFEPLLLVTALLLLPVIGFKSRFDLIATFWGLSLLAAFILLYWTLFSDRPLAHLRLWLLAGAIVLLCVTIIRAYGLTVYPYIDETDEPWDLGWAFSYLQTGEFSDWIIYYGSYDIHRFQWLVALWLRAFGVGFWQGRLFSLFMAFPVIAFTALAARNLYGLKTALFTVVVMFASASLMEGVRIRHDIGLALALAMSIWAYTEAEKRETIAWHLLAGVFVGLGLFAHYHTTTFGVVLTIAFYGPAYLTNLKAGRCLPPWGALLFITGGLLGVVSVVLVQILPHWEAFLNFRVPRNPGTVSELAQAFLGHIRTVMRYSMIEFVLIIVSLIATLWRRQRADILLLLLITLGHIGLGVVAKSSFNYVPMPLAPLYGILIAALFARGLYRRPVASPTAISRQSLVPVLAYSLLLVGATTGTQFGHLLRGGPLQLEPNEVAVWIREHVPAGTKVVAENPYFFWLTAYQFVSPLTVLFIPPNRNLRDESPAAVWEDIDADVYILDSNMMRYDRPSVDIHYLEEHDYEIVAEFPGEYEPITVYQRRSSR